MLTDYIKIQTTLYVIREERFQCVKCVKKYAGKRVDADAMLLREQESKSCREVKTDPFLEIDGGKIKFATCPGNFTFPEVLHWRDAYQRFKSGILPFPGSLMDQPNKAIEIFRLFEVDELDRAEEARKKARAEEERRRKRG